MIDMTEYLKIIFMALFQGIAEFLPISSSGHLEVLGAIFGVAESDNGVDGFKFREKPITIPKVSEIDTNVYDMRLTKHEDGWIYGLFCSERKDFSVDDTSSAVAKCLNAIRKMFVEY